MPSNSSAHRKQLIAEIAQHYIDKGEFASIEWRILRKGELLDTGAVVSQTATSPLPERPIYRIYSMTKPIVAVMAVMLLERCKLHLFDPLGKFLPEFRDLQVLKDDGSTEPAAPITIEQLFTHRAGFSYNFMPDSPVAAQYRADGLISNADCSLAAFASQAAGFPLAFQPGTRWHYSIATDILARVLEVVADLPLGALLQREIFDPLGMDETQFFVPKSEQHRLLPMYGRSLDEILAAPQSDSSPKLLDVEPSYPSDPQSGFARGGHGLFSTARDYLRFAHFTLDGCTSMGVPLISRKMVEFMWQNRLSRALLPYWLGPFVNPGYGFNLLGRVMLDPGQAVSLSGPGEGGWGGAASTYYWADRTEDFAGVIMTQHLGSLSLMRPDLMAAAYQAID